MPSSGAGPARSLLSSFAVATSGSPSLLVASDADDDAVADTVGAPHSSGDTLPQHSPPRARVNSAAAREDEEPRPSGAAPQPAPAPPAASSLSASMTHPSAAEWSSAPRAGASPPTPQLPASTASGVAATPYAWASPVWQVPPLTRQRNGTHHSGRFDVSGAAQTPFTWRAPQESAARASSSPSNSLLGRSPAGAFTPHIRYRAGTTAAPLDARHAAAPRQSTSPLRAAASHQRDAGDPSRPTSLAAPLPLASSLSTWAPRTAMDTAAAAVPTRWPLSSASSTDAATPSAWPPAIAPAAKRTSLLSVLAPPPPLLLTATGPHQRGVESPATSTSSPSTSAGARRLGWGAATRSARVVTLAIPEDACPAASGAPLDIDSEPRRVSMLSLSSTAARLSGASAATAAAAAAAAAANAAASSARSPPSSQGDSTHGAEARSSPPLPHAAPSQPAWCTSGGDVDAVCSDAEEAESSAFGHLTLRSMTDEYNRFAADGTVGWVGLQVHLRRHTQSSQIVALDLTCYRMRRDQWTWFTQDIIPQLHALAELRLVQMGLDDDAVAELVRGCCGLSAPGEGRRAASRTSPPPSRSPQTHPRSGGSGSGSGGRRHYGQHGETASTAPLPYLRVLDLSGNTITQRSCTHLGKMTLWMAATLEEVRLLGNPLKDYGMQILAVYVAKLNVGALEQDPALFSPVLLDLYAALRKEAGQGVHRSGNGHGRGGGVDDLVAALPIGPVLLDLRDCRASARGVSDMLAAASRAHRLHTLVLSHNVAGVTALLPLPATAYRDAVELGTGESAAAAVAECEQRNGEVRMRGAREPPLSPRPTPRRLRLAKTPLIYSGALLRRQQTAFSDVAGFAASCALATLVFHGVPLSQTCSPVGCRELLLNIFFSCPALDLVDLSDTFEWSLVPPAAQQALVAEANHRDAVEQRLRGPEVRRGLHMYREDQGEIEFVLDSATVCEQTRLGDVFGELMAHAAFNALVRHRLVPAAFIHVRELHLSNSGLTDAGARGLCVSVRRGRHRTGMLAALTVLNLSDNLLTVRGCVRVISTFLLADDVDAESRESTASPAWPTAAVPLAHLTALALQRNTGVESSTTAAASGDAYLRELCTAAEAAVLRRAALHSMARPCRGGSSGGDGAAAVLGASDTATAAEGAKDRAAAVPPLTLYFSAPPPLSPLAAAATAPSRRPSTSLSALAGGHVDVFYAGCDERGDVYCTCHISRLYVPKQSASQPPSPSAGTASTASRARDGGSRAANASTTSAHPWLSSVAPPTLDNSMAAFNATQAPLRASPGVGQWDGGDDYAAARPVASSSPPGAEHRSLLAALDAPRAATAATGAHHPSFVGTPAVASPTGTGGGGGEESANGLVNTTSIHHLWNSGNSANDVPTGPGASIASSSFVSFGPPPASSGSPTAGAARERRGAPRGSSEVASPDVASLGALFMKDAGDPRAAADAAAGSMEGGEGGVAVAPAAGARQSSGRRAKVRRTRTYVLSYDHPAGHLLCRVLNVLLRPSPDALGDGARAALDADLLAALQAAVPASSLSASISAVTAEEADGGAEAGAAKPANAVVFEAVHYLPPDPVTTGRDGDGTAVSDDAEAEEHWMRFEVTTNERKGAMAELLQAALNVSWDAQRECFSSLLAFLRTHVTGDDMDDGVVEGWDVVPAVERAAQASPAVRVRLKVNYGGDAVKAVHELHEYPSATGAAGEHGALLWLSSGGSRARLDQLHPTLWKRLGLPALATVALTPADSARTSPRSGARQEEGGGGGGSGSAPASGPGRRESQHHPALSPQKDVNVAAISSPSSPQPQPSDGNSRPSSLEALSSASPPPSATPFGAGSAGRQRRHVLDFYEGVEAAAVSTPPSHRQSRSGQRHGQLPASLIAGSGESDEPLGDSRSVATPEKQHSQARRLELGDGNGSAALTPPPPPPAARSAAADDGEGEGVVQVQAGELLHLDSPSAELVLTDQLVGPSPGPRKPAGAAAAAAAAHSELLKSLTAPVGLDHARPPADAGQRVASPPPPRGSGPSSPPAATSSSTREAAAAEPAAVAASVGGGSGEEEVEEEETAIASPIRVQRRTSQLVGRVKTFTLSYTHQEGTVICRAWRLLHLSASANRSGSESNVSREATAEVGASPTLSSPPRALAAVAQEARECLCNDFLAFLQPPDDDIEHVVLSVSLHGDGGVATAMLQVQVQTNERRAALADRLQHSNHGVRRGLAGRGGRGGLVPLTVQEVDRYYFPRLTRFLRRYKSVADTAAQLQAYLEPRAELQARLLQSYGSVGALVHYYHGSPAALEHELGVSSWQSLTEPQPQPSPPPATGTSGQLTEDVMSPTVAVDRVRVRDQAAAAAAAAAPTAPVAVTPGGPDKGRGGSLAIPETSTGYDAAEGSVPADAIDADEPSRTPTSQGVASSAGRPSPPPASAPSSRPPSRSASAGATVAAAPAVPGRPPPHPRRPPTPPHAITHTSSISFDEVTEEPTSEAGPVVVLRGSTPTPTPRSPSNSLSLNPQYFPVVYRQAITSATPPSRSTLDDGAERSSMPQLAASSSLIPVAGGSGEPAHDADTDSGMVSPLTALSSAAASPNPSHLGPAHASSSLSASPAPRMELQLDVADEAPAALSPPDGMRPPLRSSPAEPPYADEHVHSSPLGPSGVAIPSVSSLSSVIKPSPKLQPEPGTAPPPRTAAGTERSDDHSSARGGGGNTNKNAAASSATAAAAAAVAAGARPPKPDSRRTSTISAIVPPTRAGHEGRNAEYERVLEGKYKRLMRVAYEGVAHGSVPLAPQHQQKTVLGRGKWGTQKVELSLEWEILFVLTFEKSRKIGRSSRRAQMLVHPVGFGFECVAGDEASGHGGSRFGATASGTFYFGDASSLHSSAVNGETGDSMHHHPSTTPSSKTSRKKESTRSLASHLIIHVQRPFTPDEVGSSAQEMEKTLLAGALLTVSSTTSKGAWLLGSDDASNASRASAVAPQTAQEFVFQLCQPSITLDIEMKNAQHVQEALRLLKHSIRRATQAIEKAMLNANLPLPKS